MTVAALLAVALMVALGLNPTLALLGVGLAGLAYLVLGDRRSGIDASRPGDA